MEMQQTHYYTTGTATATNGKTKVYLLLCVYDIIVASKSEAELKVVKTALKKELDMKDLVELHYILGIKIERTNDGMIVGQSTYLRNLLKRFNMEVCKPTKTPMEVKSRKETDLIECIIESKPYRELIGCLMYVMLNMRPNLSAAVNYYSRFQSTSAVYRFQESL
jgi:hypothetical protein